MPTVGLAVLDVLDRHGCAAEFPPGQTCCGQPFFNAGRRPEAARLARATLEVLAPFDAVVVPSGSCAAMIKHHYRDLFAPDAPIQRLVGLVADRTFEFSQFLVEKLGATEAEYAGFAGTVTVHDGCHSLRELGVRDGPRRLLAGVPGCRVTELADGNQCCGFGGTFSVSFERLSASMGNDKVDAIVATGADAVVSCDPSCLLHLRGIMEHRGIEVRAFHLAEILAGRGDT